MASGPDAGSGIDLWSIRWLHSELLAEFYPDDHAAIDLPRWRNHD